MTTPTTVVDASKRHPVRRRVVAVVLGAVDGIGWAIEAVLGPRAFWTLGSRRFHVIAGWIITRLFMLVMFVQLEERVGADVEYYLLHLQGGTSAADTLREYPVAAVGLVALPLLVGSSSVAAYRIAFICLMLLTDAVFTWVLARRDASGRGVTLWLAAAPFVGPLMITRFDLVPGVLVSVAVVVLATRPRLAATLAMVAAAVKLWPLLLVPALATPTTTRRRVIVASLVSGVVLAAAVLSQGGLDRVLSPLDYQSRRGLQVESLPAWPLMAVWSLVHAPWTVGFSDFVCTQVSGPGDTLMLALSTLAGIGVVILAGVLTWRLWRRGETVTPAMIGWFVLATISLFVVTNKVFSPQYLLWLVPVSVVLVAFTEERAARRIAVTLLVVGALGQVLYPGIYPWVSDAKTQNSIGVTVLALRMAPLVVVAIYSVRRAWSESREPQTSVAELDTVDTG